MGVGVRHHSGFPSFPSHPWADGCIYYILSGETGRVKIGFTNKDPSRRLRALQTGSPTRLGIAALHPGDQALERSLHERFSADRAHGEWFEMSDAMLLHLAEVVALALALFKHAGEEPPAWAVIAEKGIRDLCEWSEAEIAGNGATIQ